MYHMLMEEANFHKMFVSKPKRIKPVNLSGR